MAQRPRQLTVRYSLLIEPRLTEIWRWNAERYGEAHATLYVDFLQKHTRALRSEYLKGRPIPNRPSYRYTTIKKRAKGHGYVLVYEIRDNEIYAFYYFHTAQDWLPQLESMLKE